MHLAINAFFWNQPHTGSGQYTRNLVYHLNRLVSDLTITLVYPRTEAQPDLHDVPPSVHRHPLRARSGHLGKIRFEQQAFPQACRELGVDLAHVPYWGSPLRSPVPVVVTVHDLTTLLFRPYRRRAVARLYTSLVGAAARGADHILTDSQASRQDIIQHLAIPEAKVTTVYLAAGPQFQPADNSLLDMAARQAYGLPDYYLLYLGGYEHHKNVVSLLEAYTYVASALGPDYPLMLAGRQPATGSPHSPDYQAIIAALGLEERVRWLGFIAESDKPALYRGAETFIFPSRYEGFGLPPLEALACGVPVVATDCSSLPEVIGDAGFTVDPDDQRAMAGAIISTITDEALAADLRSKGPLQAARFSWENTAVETLRVYDAFLSAPR